MKVKPHHWNEHQVMLFYTGQFHMYVIHLKFTNSTLNPNAAGGYFGQYKMMQKSLKMIETLANGYSSESTQRELST